MGPRLPMVQSMDPEAPAVRRPAAPRISSRSPASLRIARSLERRGYRQLPDALLGLARRSGRLERVVEHELPGGLRVEVPLWQAPIDARDLQAHRDGVVRVLARRIDRLGLPTAVVDVGAGIGLVPALLGAASPHVCEVVAIEQDPEQCRFLARNLAALARTRQIEARPVGVAAGAVAAQGIDAMGLAGGGCLVVRMDVDGAEDEVIEGALATLTAVEHAIIAFTVRVAGIERLGSDPSRVVAGLGSVGAVAATVVERPGVVLDPARPFLDQVRGEAAYTVVCELAPSAGVEGRHAA